MSRKQSSNGDERSRHQRTVSISLQDRGQTTQDFAVGIGIFILAVAFVFAFLPTLLAPFDSTVSGAQTAQADRVADRLVENLSVEGEPNTIDGNQLEKFDDDDDRAKWLGLRASDDVVYDRVNIRLEHPDGTTVGPQWTVGDEYDNQSAASSARLVTVEDGPDDCEIACRLLVRVW